MSDLLSSKDMAAIRVLVQWVELQRRQPLQGAGRGLWHILSIDLSDAKASAGGLQLQAPGAYGLVALKNGSNPGARLKLTVNGSEARQFGPGSTFTGPFDSLLALREDGSAATGFLQVLVLDSPFASFNEANVTALAPVALLGTRVGAVYNFVLVAEDTDPVNGALNVTGAFDVSGFSKIRVLIDGRTGGVDFTTADLVPFSSPDYTPAAGGTWFEQGLERVSIPDTDAVGSERYRSVVLDVTGVGFLYLAIRNLLLAARTGLSFYVEGIR